jgi:stage IV sporulation protein FA
MADWGYELNKNREKKIRSLEKKLVLENHIPRWEPENKLTTSENPMLNIGSEVHPVNHAKRANTFLIQLVAASILFFVTLLGVRYPDTEQWIKTVWDQKIPYDKLTAWYQEVVGSRPTLLPVFSEQRVPKQQEISWLSPVKGKVVLSYSQQRKGIVIQTAGKVPVVASRDGIVTFVGTKPGIGQTVIVRHGDNKETWYGFLGQVTPKVNDVVKKGRTIGQVLARSDHYFVYFALQTNGKFTNPTGIIPFG